MSAAALACATALLLSGCGGGTSAASSGTPEAGASTGHADASGTKAPSKADLDAYVATVQRGMKSSIGSSVKKVYSSIRTEPVYPSGIKYVYVFKNQVDVSKGAQYLDTQLPLLKAAFRTQVAPEMKRVGFAHPSATWTYVNPDGTLIWTHTVS
jgi:hypothetical protein